MPAPTSQGWFQLSHIHVVWGLQNASSFMSSEQQHHTCPLHLNQILAISSQVFFFWCVNHIRHHTFCRVLQHVINPSNFGIFKSFWYSKSSSFCSGVLSLQYKWLQAKKKVKGKNRLYGSLKPVDDQHGMCLVLAALFSEPWCPILSELLQTCSLHGEKEWVAKRRWLWLFTLIMNV